ncbi:MAG: hypothetical protein ACFB4J_07465 [Elainellaceae cyanobacterium]
MDNQDGLTLFGGALSHLKQRLEGAVQDIGQDLTAVSDGVSSTVADAVAATTERAMQSLDYTVTQAEGVTSSIAQELWRTIEADFEGWLQGHPLLLWLLMHPLITLGLSFTVVVLVWGLVQAMAQLAQRAWIVLLNVPLYLARLALMGLNRFRHWTTVQIANWYRAAIASRPSSQLDGADDGQAQGRQSPQDCDAGAARDVSPHPAELMAALVAASNGSDPRTAADWAVTIESAYAGHLSAPLDLIEIRKTQPLQGSSDRELIEALRRLEHLTQAQTRTLQHLIQLLEARTAS